MANIKPAALRTGKTGKVEIARRKKAEDELKGSASISNKAPGGLTKRGAETYAKIIELLPDEFLCGSDTYVVGIVADALDRMHSCQQVLNDTGMFEDGVEKDAVKTYERFTKIFDKFSSKLGLSPRDRAALAAINVKAEEEKNDPLLQVLRGD